MKRLQVTFRPSAEADLRELYDFIAEEAGTGIAGGERIEAACLGLETFPLRGRARDEIRPGIRSLSFERRATIVYRVLKAEVVIVRILTRGRDFERLLRDADGEGMRSRCNEEIGLHNLLIIRGDWAALHMRAESGRSA